jgi:hypothetical protein
MNQRLRLSDEMMRYIDTGTCPRCGVEILQANYVRGKRAVMLARATGTNSTLHERLVGVTGDPLRPPWAKIASDGPFRMKCLTCMGTWSYYPPWNANKTNTSERLLRLPSDPKPPTASQSPAASEPVAQPTPWIVGKPRPVSNIDLTNYRLVGVTDEQWTETVLRQETKTYPNQSSGRITPKIGITDTVTKSVTFETSKLKSIGSQAGVQILGFASIQGQIQRQLGERYAVEVQRTLSVNEEVQIEVPPHQTIEFTIIWKLVSLTGSAQLGSFGGISRAEVPYSIPQRLSFDWRTRDVPSTEQRKK